MHPFPLADRPLKIAIVGTGISGLSAGWLLSQRHEVTVFEADERVGGHSNTVDAHGMAVDTGFIVYNDVTYPNLAALFRLLGVESIESDMSFAVSLDGGRLEYSGNNLSGLFAQRRNLASRRFWSMLRDLVRFYRVAPDKVRELGPDASLDQYLDADGFGRAFREDHLYPMAAAIWSTPSIEIGSYPAAAFIRFCENHGLLSFFGRPVWRTVKGGSRAYVEKLSRPFGHRIRTSSPVTSIRRQNGAVEIAVAGQGTEWFDHVVIGAHADQALRMLADPSEEEAGLLSTFAYGRNETVLHQDEDLMPQRRAIWSSWNYLGDTPAGGGKPRKPCVSYWMNRLQSIPDSHPLFVTLSPLKPPREETVIWRGVYEHPLFNRETFTAQEALWNCQGVRNTWFCGSYFGAGFHEDGLQSALAVAETLGGAKRPWVVEAESGRIRRREVEASPLARADDTDMGPLPALG